MIKPYDDTTPNEEGLEIIEQPNNTTHDEKCIEVVGLAVTMPSESNKSSGFKDRMSPNEEANARALANTTSEKTMKI